MLSRFKFLYLLLMSLVTLSHAEIWPSVSYDYRLRVSDNGNIWLYNGIVYHSVQYCRYTKVENYPNNPPKFDTTSFKINSFYSFVDPHTKGPSAYDTDLRDPGYLAKYLGFDSIPCPEDSSRTCYNIKYETYTNATLPNEPSSIDCVSCVTTSGEHFDSTTGLCVNKCEDITNRSDRLDCMCKRAGKIGYNGSFITMFIGGDGSKICSYGCKTTKDDPEARPNGDGTEFSVHYDIKDTDTNANGFCFADDTYAPNATPGPNPKPDKPNPDKPDKPNPDKPNPDNPNPGGGGGKPGGGGGNPGGGGNKPDNPGNNNGTNPGGGGGGKPGDKEDDKGKFNPKDFDDGGLSKERNNFYGSVKDHLNNGLSKFNSIREGIDQFIKNVQGKGFAKVSPEVKRSCPIKKEIMLPDGKVREIVVDYCESVAPASEVSYYVFYIFFLVSLFLLFLKLLTISIR